MLNCNSVWGRNLRHGAPLATILGSAQSSAGTRCGGRTRKTIQTRFRGPHARFSALSLAYGTPVLAGPLAIRLEAGGGSGNPVFQAPSNKMAFIYGLY
jgi:hypothetical protein